MSIVQIGGFLGGIGLFLLGMWLMTDGLKVVAGPSLKSVLATWTKTRFHGLLTGISLTALVQSSSAVTVATIGFVNAGLLSLERAVWLVFGSNVGTTMTSWLVALVGVSLRIDAFALPLIGLGMLLRLTAPGSRRGAAGEALAGFGVFFLGIAVLKDNFEILAGSVDVTGLASGGLLNALLFVGIGFLVTLLSQSSSASIAIAITAAAGGLIGLEMAAAMVIGANLGTTSTAAFAVIGATPNAKRVATAHVLFNVLVGVVSFLLLPLLLALVTELSQHLRLPGESVTATTIALYHTLVKILGVLAIWPLAGPLVRWLRGRFVTVEEDEAQPRHLDATALVVPSLAMESLIMELRRMEEIALNMAQASLADRPAPAAPLRARAAGLQALATAIGDYVRKLNTAKLPEALADSLGHPLRIAQHFHEIGRRSITIAEGRQNLLLLPADLQVEVDAYRRQIAARLVLPPREQESEDVKPADAIARIENDYQRLKSMVLSSAARYELGFMELEETLQLIHHMRRCAERSAKARFRFEAVRRRLADLEAPEQLEEVDAEDAEEMLPGTPAPH